jgi:hypothetical protein
MTGHFTSYKTRPNHELATQRAVTLASGGAHHHALGMFVITEADADAIRAVFNQEGELSAAIELRRRFPGVTDNAKARDCARRIWRDTLLPVLLTNPNGEALLADIARP